MFFRSLFLLSACLAIAACSSNAPVSREPLSERLAEKTPAERKETLLQACLKEAVSKPGGRHSGYGVGYTALCEEMYKAME